MRLRLAATASAVLLVACSGGGPADPPAEAGGRATTITTAPGDGPEASAELTPPSIELLDAGAEPRHVLRFAFVPGGRVVVDQESSIDQELAGQRTGVVTTETATAATVVAVDGGVATIEVSYDEVRVTAGADVDPAVVASTEQGAVVLEGATATVRIDEQGGVESFDLRFPPGAPPGIDRVLDSLASTFQQQTVAFPVEPVGLGGSWVVRYEVDVLGVLTTIEQTFTMAARSDDAVELTVATSGTFSGVGDGSTDGSGTMRVAFDSFLPDAALVSRNVITVQEQELVQDLVFRAARRP